ncbi:MAG: hypothetical protein A2X25_15545 [Chloroflexi bacterium GWB2_49_20]|nr:MAG: hypothetical protein A2X25_15545 [Chloroflexi bacterium GWB2_49_20]OGN77481.1 MAG: hypothetical protein A2X26_13775 [Chloroflexi bacterium GWC2_49_37]OGN84815.1 MAG: hypothetical protein A2X27_14675 [Chloroflexi bacterium GWD2_49_16]HCC79262.1 hypothetical protein [Anaerolineae bacterium]
MKLKRLAFQLLSITLIISLTLGCKFLDSLATVTPDPNQALPTLAASQGTPSGQDQYRQVSSEPPTLPAPPKPVSSPQGTPDVQAIYFADQLASGKDHLAVWMGLYDALGIPLIGQGGEPLGSTGDDPIGPRFWQMWYSSGLDLPGRGIPLEDVGRLFANALPDMDGTGFGGMLLDDLRLAAQSNDPQVRLMGLFVRERILRGPSHVDILDASVTPDTAVVDIPSVQLISWVIIRSALFQAASQASVPGGSITLVDYQPRSVAQLGPQINCSDLPGAGSTPVAWHNWIINKVGGGFQLPGMTDEMAFPSFVESIVGKVVNSGSADRIEKITKLSGKMLGFLNVITSAISLILQLQAMEIDVRMDPMPLVRTHYTSNNNEATIELELYTDPKGRPDGDELESCLSSYFLNALGVSFGFPTKGAIPGAEIVVEAGMGIPELVLINESRMRFTTGTDGRVSFHVIGKAQRETIPDSAPPVDKEFSIRLSAQPEEAGLGSMANIFFGGLGVITGGAAGFLSSLIDVLKTFHYDMGEKVLPLIDWETTGWKVEPFNDPSVDGFEITGGLNCDSPYGPWEFKTEGTTSQGGTISQTWKIPFSADGNTTATQNEHLTLPSVGMVGDYNGTPKVTIIPVPGGYRMDFGSFRMTGSTCVANNPCQPYDNVKNAWTANIIPADPGQCPNP